MLNRLATFLILLAMLTASGTALSIESDTIDPPSYQQGQTLDHLFMNIDVEGLSSDGETDTVYYTFPETVLLDPRNVNASIPHGELEFVDRDEDGFRESVKIPVNPESSEDSEAEITLNTGAKFEGYGDLRINLTVEDSQNGVATGNGTLVFEGNAPAIEHIRDNHTHENDFEDAVGCEPDSICLEIPDPLYYLESFLNFF